MGLHAFRSEPQHCAIYRQLREACVHPVPDLFGIDSFWNMPAVRHNGHLGRGTRFDGVDHYVLTYHVGGANVRRLDLGNGSVIASTGALSMQAPGSSGVFASEGVVDYGHFYFQHSLIDEVFDESDRAAAMSFGDVFALFDDVAARDASSYLLRALDRDDPPTALEMDNRAYLLVHDLSRALHRRNGDTIALKAIDPGCPMRLALDYIEDHLSDSLRLTDLAASVDMSPFHFSRVFRSEVGETPSRYLMRRRVERARELVEHSKLSLAEVAYRTGFSSQSHMTTRMKALTGRTPGDLRRG